MGIINLTITESSDQTLPGIPNKVFVAANEPATIFYTLDGSSPSTYSPIYVNGIVMPENLLDVTLSIFATNGIDSSATIVNSYSSASSSIETNVGNRVPHATVTPLNNASTNNSLFPFGTNSPNPNFNYKSTADAGVTVYDQSQPATPSGFDGSGDPAGFVNNPSTGSKFKQIYSTANFINEVTPGVGNLPAKVTIIGKQTPMEYIQEQSSTSDKIFNPKALVIYQDTTTEDPTNPVHINRPYFALENQEIVRDGNLLYNSTLDSPTTTGSFVNRHYNARTNMMTSSFYDNTVGRWIFVSTPFQPTTKDVGAYYQMVFGRSKENSDGTKVYKWIPFLNRYLA